MTVEEWHAAWRQGSPRAMRRGRGPQMCQMEVAAPIAEAKRAEVAIATRQADRRISACAAFAAADCELLHPRDMPRHAASEPAAAPGTQGTDRPYAQPRHSALSGRPPRQDIRCRRKSFSPDLQPFRQLFRQSGLPRLAATMRARYRGARDAIALV